MGSRRRCEGCLSALLVPLALWSVIVNVLLYFPNGQAAHEAAGGNHVWYFEGICFSGVLMLVVAVALLVLDNDCNYHCCPSENCSEGYTMALSLIFAALGVASSGYCLAISAVGLIQGPYCRTHGGWGYALEDTEGRILHPERRPPAILRNPAVEEENGGEENSFLTDSSVWSRCLEPAHVVEWNMVLFCALIALSGLQVIVCLLRVAVQLNKVLCGAYKVMVQPGII